MLNHVCLQLKKRNPRAVKPSKVNDRSLARKIQKQITKAVQTTTEKICTNKGHFLCSGPSGTNRTTGAQRSVGPPGIKGQKGDPAEAISTTPTSLQPFQGQPGDVISTPEILVKPAVKNVTLNESATFQCLW